MLLDELFNDQVFLPAFGEREETVTDAKGRSYVAVAHAGPRTLGQKSRDPSRLFTIELYPIVKGQRARSRIGWVNFARVEDHLEAEDVYIEPRYRRRGLATGMYQLARKLGNDIRRSSKQTGLGREFWASKSPVAEAHLNTDVPNEEWLADKQGYARKRGRDQWGAPYFGTITAVPANRENVMVSVVRLHLLKGMRREQDNVRQQDLEWLMDYMGRTGKLPPGNHDQEYVPYIMVAYNGEAWVNEGNHRIMAAYRLGWPKMPIEIAYFDGGERVKDGIMYPGKIGLGEPGKLEELSFLGSPCTKDCSGHRAGYEWYKRNGRRPASWSTSFNNGAALAQAGK